MASVWKALLNVLGLARAEASTAQQGAEVAAEPAARQQGPARGHAPVESAGDDSGTAVARDAAATPARTRVIALEGGGRVELDLGSQRLRVDAPEPVERRPELERAARVQPELRPTPEVAPRGARFVSAAMLGIKAKQFDDGLLAAMELALDRGRGDLPGTTALVAGLLRALEPLEGPPEIAREILRAAAHLGEGAPPAARPDRAVRARITAFEREDARARLVGFYAWSDELAALFRRDRMLQTLAAPEVPGEQLAALARAVHAEPWLRSAYERHLALRAKLTGAPASPDLRAAFASLDRGEAPGALGPDTALFPAARDPGARLLARLLPDPTRPAPRSFDLARAAADAARTRALALTPDANSGWYDAQLWALEPLVAPARTREAKRVRFTPAYRAALVELFKTLMALSRESHATRLERAPRRASAAAAGADVRVAPALRVEPLAEHYLRRAAGYRFVREVLTHALGRTTLASVHALRAEGPREAPLLRELAQLEALFYGAHVVAREDLGLAPVEPARVGSGDPARDAAGFLRWAKRAARDPDIGTDARTMVPLSHDLARGRTRVWALLGWTSRPLVISFAKPPAVRVLDAQGRDITAATPIKLVPQHEPLHYPVTAELEVERVLDRDRFRKVCDRHKTRAAIIAHLTGAKTR